MNVIVARIGGEVFTFDSDNTVVYKFRTSPGLDHAFFNDDQTGFYVFHRPFVSLCEQATFTVVTSQFPPESDKRAFDRYMKFPPSVEILTEADLRGYS